MKKYFQAVFLSSLLVAISGLPQRVDGQNLDQIFAEYGNSQSGFPTGQTPPSSRTNSQPAFSSNNNNGGRQSSSVSLKPRQPAYKDSAKIIDKDNDTRIVFPNEDTNKNRIPTHVSLLINFGNTQFSSASDNPAA